MKRFILIVGACLLAFSFSADVFAAEGRSLNPLRTPEFVRNPAQFVNTTDPLAIAVYNPAGFVKLEDGFYVGLGNIFTLKGNEMKAGPNTYKQNSPSPLLPTAAFAWKTGKAAFFANVEAIDGGGKIEYDELPIFHEAPISDFIDSKFEGESSWMQFKLGLSLELNDLVSLTGGVRYITANEKAKITNNTVGIVKNEYEATGQAGFFGINITPVKEATVNISYFTKAFVEGKSKEKNPLTDKEGIWTDIVPAYFTFGIAYAVMPELTVSAGFNYSFTKEERHGDTDKRFANQKNALEVVLGADYKVSDTFLVSAGVAYKKAGGVHQTYDAQAYNPDLDLKVIGGGAKIAAMPDLNVNLGLMKAFFKDGKGDMGITYKRDAWLFSTGVDYKI